LGRGSFGDPVVLLQARLSQLGYFTYPDDTGYFGDATFGAVYSFQQARGLVNSGVADAATVIALNACDGRCADLPLPGAAVTGR
ncbi:MAG TPA: peptidoglycan-binding domain-containing protein, partial [Candidatus Limnocylindrales bacterium]|nr:peptidoglycan-binding domain-containing protein [Candidatus Limnocylindrales bacterium]